MTMRAVPRRWFSGERIKYVPAPKGTAILECELDHPPSAKGRTVYVMLHGEDLTDALKLLRDAAIYARSDTL